MGNRWNILEDLVSEEEISDFLEAAIEEGEGDLCFFIHCLPKALTARAINQIVKETGIDRKTLCDMFLEANSGDTKALKANAHSILEAAKTFAAPPLC